MRRIGILPLLTILLAVACGVWWFVNFERVTEPVYTGLKGTASEDPYLALRQLLKRGKLPIESFAGAATPEAKFDRLPAGGTLLLSDRRHLLMMPARVKQIVKWVEAGGHLIVEAEYPGRPDPLLAAFGLGRNDLVRPKSLTKTLPRKAQSEADAPTVIDGSESKPALDDEDDDEGKFPEPAPLKDGSRRTSLITAVTLPDNGRSLMVEFGAYQNLDARKAKGFLLAADPLGLRFASAVRGQGRVTALSNFDFLTYRGTFGVKDVALQPTHIGKYDHAEMIMRLVRLNPNHAKTTLRLVWLNDEVSLWTWLVSHAAFALLSLGLLLVVWLWRVVPRFGPLTPEPAPAEQKLSSHIEAVGRFYWKHMEPATIHARLQTTLLRRLSERRPGMGLRETADRNAQLAQLAGVRQEAVARALDQPSQSVGELIRNAVLIQHISQKL